MGRDQTNKLFIGGLSYDTDDKGLREYFERYGPLSDYIVMRYSDNTRRSRGFGFVSFENKADMDHCLSSQPHNLDGRTVELKIATPKEDTPGGRGRDDEESVDPEDKLMRKLFIGGLNYTTTESGMQEYFEKFGTLEDCVVMKFPDTKRSRGFGFVTFEKAYMVDECQRNRPHVLDGRTVECKRATPRSAQNNPESQATVKKIFVGNVTEEMSDADVENYFAKFGNVVSVQQMKWNDTGKKRGFGFVEFDDTDAVDKICLLGKHFLLGKRLEIRKALSKTEMAMLNKGKDDMDRRGGGRDMGRGGGDSYGQGGYGMGGGMGNMGGNQMQQMMGMMGGGGGGSNSGMNPMMMMQMMMNMMGGGGGGGGNMNMMGGGDGSGANSGGSSMSKSDGKTDSGYGSGNQGSYGSYGSSASGGYGQGSGGYGYGYGNSGGNQDPSSMMSQMMAAWGSGGGGNNSAQSWGDSKSAYGGSGGGPMRGTSRENTGPYSRR